MRPRRRAGHVTRFVIGAVLLALPVPPADLHAGIVAASLPPNFRARFQHVCKVRGFSEERCACMARIVLTEVADENLALMLGYFENPSGFDMRAMEELDNDETRMRVLAEEIEAAQNAAKAECVAR